MSESTSGDALDAVAVIGMSGRFPGAQDLDQFWRNLRGGVESIAHFTDAELLAAGVSPRAWRDPSYVRARAILSDVDLFDASFFGYRPREAELLDPQQRLFLECAWEALEVAGYDAARLPGLTGVFAGTSLSTYLLNNLRAQPRREPVDMFQAMLSNDKDFFATQVSYRLNLKGPSLTVQTACSTSLVAVCLACQSLLTGQCDLALAGGASISVPQKQGYFHREGMIFSPDGHCRAFDAQAGGTVGGDGVGVVLLRRLSDAVADRDPICAVIRGWAINNDGADKVGYTAPSVSGQAQVIAQALAMADVPAETIGYVEAHGTATAIGDPIEITALAEAFGPAVPRSSCALGSVKTNIGHLDAAAGVAGLIKTVLSLQHGEIPPSLHFRAPNPKIRFAETPFHVSTSLAAWQAAGGPRRAPASALSALAAQTPT